MSSREDDDIRLHKASASLLTDLLRTLKVILWKISGTVHRLVRVTDLEKAVALIEPFQEEPQLLDPHLKHIVPPLIEAFLLQLQNERAALQPKTVTTSYAICKILYTLCKVRGEKVIVGFFNHDPPNLERILGAYEIGQNSIGKTWSWEQRYILMLWLCQLMLVPFDLQTLSNELPISSSGGTGLLEIPSGLPSIAVRVLPLCCEGLASATKERDAAAKLLVRLALRGDVRGHGLLEAVIPWVMQHLRSDLSDPSSLYQRLGMLSVLSNFTASASPEVASRFLHQIYSVCQAILIGDLNTRLGSNAVARKSLTKISRNIVLLCLQSPELIESIDPNDILSEVIESLLTLVSDSDTPVRFAASKALSAITLKLDPSMSSEVIEAILGSLQEDIITDSEGQRSTSAVNALRWHGLTLALAQLLYKRAPSTGQLSDILQALAMSLDFSQRSATGVAIGTNVRDAACFGIWALSRRYTTAELFAIDLKSLIATDTEQSDRITVTVFLATRLLAAACSDPSGNIRRGSSAALQELIGRHPNTVPEGISLVQVVDYQAVGLRRRAMIEVGLLAAALDPLYWDVLYSTLQKERGLFAVDELSRSYAAEALGLLVKLRGFSTALHTLQQLQKTFSQMKRSISVQDKHGLLLAFAAVLSQDFGSKSGAGVPNEAKDTVVWTQPSQLRSLIEILDISLLLDIPDKDLTSATRSPQLTAAAICQLISSLTSALVNISGESRPSNAGLIVDRSEHLFNLCLLRTEPEILELVPSCVPNILALTSQWRAIIQTWLTASAVHTHSLVKDTSQVVALGAATCVCRTDDSPVVEIIETIASRCSSIVNIESRVLAVRALSLAMPLLVTNFGYTDALGTRLLTTSANAMHTALNDYTINERGDVGSLVRLEALSTLEILYHSKWQWDIDGSIHQMLVQDVAQLCLAKLDKVRQVARKCIVALGWSCPSSNQISSSEWFSYWLNMLCEHSTSYLRRSIIEGYFSSAGMAAENVIHASRSALLIFLEGLPTEPFDNSAFALLEFANVVKSSFQENLSNERVLLPLMETLAFMLDMQVFQRLVGSPFKWRGLLILVQKAHYQSKSIPKISLALDIYRGLAEVPELREDVMKKLKDMKRNPMAPIKRATEETLYIIEEVR